MIKRVIPVKDVCYKKKQLRLLDTLQTHVRKKECYYSISFGSGNLPTCTLRKRFKRTEPGETSFQTSYCSLFLIKQPLPIFHTAKLIIE